MIQVGGEPRPVIPQHVLDRMTDTMAHRGPYDRGTYAEPGAAIGARRLPLVDVKGGHQPFSNEDAHVWAILNGMLYNHNELRAELAAEGHSFRSRCDTEVTPHLYERFGEAFPERVRGEFGIAVWDGRERRAVLARDRFNRDAVRAPRARAQAARAASAGCVETPARLRPRSAALASERQSRIRGSSQERSAPHGPNGGPAG